MNYKERLIDGVGHTVECFSCRAFSHRTWLIPQYIQQIKANEPVAPFLFIVSRDIEPDWIKRNEIRGPTVTYWWRSSSSLQDNKKKPIKRLPALMLQRPVYPQHVAGKLRRIVRFNSFVWPLKISRRPASALDSFSFLLRHQIFLRFITATSAAAAEFN